MYYAINLTETQVLDIVNNHDVVVESINEMCSDTNDLANTEVDDMIIADMSLDD